MKIPRLVHTSRPASVALGLMLAVVLVVSLGAVALAEGVPVSERALSTAWATEIWTGTGAQQNCAVGGYYHWVLTVGEGVGGFAYVSATLHVVYDRGASTATVGTTSADGAMHFDVYEAPGRAVYAWVCYEYQGFAGDKLLQITHVASAMSTTGSSGATGTSQSVRLPDHDGLSRHDSLSDHDVPSDRGSLSRHQRFSQHRAPSDGLGDRRRDHSGD